MCRTVYIPRENAMDLEVTTIGALRSALGVAPIIRDGYPELPDDSCLCPCDIEATAEAGGWDIRNEYWDGWVLTPNARNQRPA